MSRLADMMAQRKAARVVTKEVVKLPLITPVDPKVVEPTTTATAKPAANAIVQAKPTAFKLKSTVSTGLSEISTQLAEVLTDAEQKVADQQAAGVYELTEEVHTLMGTDAEALILCMQNLDAALIEKTPEIRTLSRDIRKNLEQYPELVHILRDEQMHIMVQGYLTIANVKTAPKTKAAKTAAAGKKADATIKSLGSKSVDDLF